VETFSGVTESACKALTKKQHVSKEMPLKAIPKGSVITVFYNPRNVKRADGSKSTVNTILGIRFDEVNGQKIGNEERPIIPCSKGAAGESAF
jgi:hypothetical protein